MKNLRKRWVIWLGLSLVLGLVLVCLVSQLSKRKQPVTNPPPGKIAFVWGSSEIYVMDSDGSNLTQLTDRIAGDLTWSPDGTHLAITSYWRYGNRGEIYVMRSDGSGLVNVSNHPASDDFPAWSPDSARVAFKTCASEEDDDGELYVVDRDGSNPVRLFDRLSFYYDEFAWSPDGGRIAFEAEGEIYVVDRDGSSLVNLTNHPADDGNLGWSPDGGRIAFTSDRDGGNGIYTMNSDGSSLTFLTPGEFDSWSPDGGRIFYWRDGLYVMGSDGSDPTLLSRDARPGLWSPDHAHLAYGVLDTIAMDWAVYSFFVMRGDGSWKTRLAKGVVMGYDWSPDGQYVVYSKYAKTAQDIFIASVDGTRESRLTDCDGSSDPVWQPQVP